MGVQDSESSGEESDCEAEVNVKKEAKKAADANLKRFTSDYKKATKKAAKQKQTAYSKRQNRGMNMKYWEQKCYNPQATWVSH